MHISEDAFETRVAHIVAAYGRDLMQAMPREDAWHALARCASDQPVTLVNFFKIRDQAVYPPGHEAATRAVTGQQAFDCYAEVSMPNLQQVGGRFLLVAPFGGGFIGAAEDWDLVAVGTYPGPEAILALFELDAYRNAYVHRVAACADQRVSLCLG